LTRARSRHSDICWRRPVSGRCPPAGGCGGGQVQQVTPTTPRSAMAATPDQRAADAGGGGGPERFDRPDGCLLADGELKAQGVSHKAAYVRYSRLANEARRWPASLPIPSRCCAPRTWWCCCGLRFRSSRYRDTPYSALNWESRPLRPMRRCASFSSTMHVTASRPARAG
jgi:hypothetical protein